MSQNQIIAVVAALVALFEAIAIVLVVSFLSLGLRAGLVEGHARDGIRFVESGWC
jgi:hypothetical protein